MTATVDPTTMRWEEALRAGRGSPQATASFLHGKGQLTGTADLSISGSGTGGMVGLVFGNGEFSARDGALSGFDAIKTLSKDGTVRFASALSYFSVDGRSLYLMPGTRVTAPIGDPIYRYLFANGSIGIGDSPLDLKCSVDINIKALNALLGALQGILSVEGNPLTDPGFFRNFLSGLVGGISTGVPGDLLNLKGSWKSPNSRTPRGKAAEARPFPVTRPGRRRRSPSPWSSRGLGRHHRDGGPAQAADPGHPPADRPLRQLGGLHELKTGTVPVPSRDSGGTSSCTVLAEPCITWDSRGTVKGG